MGLDLALGGLVLFVAIRGWFRGFVVQAIRLGGLVAAAYAAVPVRDQAKPYALEYFPAMRPELVDRILWWVSAAVSYFVIVGVAPHIAQFGSLRSRICRNDMRSASNSSKRPTSVSPAPVISLIASVA